MTSSKTLLSALERFQDNKGLHIDDLHPFATGAPHTCDHLQDLINVADVVSRSLSIYDTTTAFSNPKLVSLLRQLSSTEHALQSSERNVAHLISALQERKGVSYGENIPLLPSSIPDFCVDQFVAWGKSVQMESFSDDGNGPNSVTVVLAGKLLVIDIELVVKHIDPLRPRLHVASVKSTNALTSTSTSIYLDAFLLEELTRYCDEMQKTEDVRDPQRAAAIRGGIIDHLRYLVLLDRLAGRKQDGGIRWFTDLDEVFPRLRDACVQEVRSVGALLSTSKVPLDIFLARGHALPLPYLLAPSLTFLAYLSPAAYYSILRSAPQDAMDSSSDFGLDIPISHLRSRLLDLQQGVTLATLALTRLSEDNLYPSAMSMNNTLQRPTFPLVEGFNLEHPLPQFAYPPTDMEEDASPQGPFCWVLDFTNGGKRRGVVMSQSRLKEIELVVNPLGSGEGFDPSNEPSFGLGSWVDLLLHPGTVSSPETYTTLYTSPKSLHPPLQLRLTAPQEPGFILEQVPVHTIKEAWGVLEIVREQCWLNEILLGCKWSIEGLKSEEQDIVPDDTDATEEELQAVLAGTSKPRKIPVNVFLPTYRPTASVYGAEGYIFPSPSKPRIVMTFPERPPIPGLVELSITHDETQPRGVSVEMQGGMGCELKPADFEEICRRGGALGLPGRIWTR